MVGDQKSVSGQIVQLSIQTDKMYSDEDKDAVKIRQTFIALRFLFGDSSKVR